MLFRGKGHGDRKGRHYYTTKGSRSRCIVVAGLAPAMLTFWIRISEKHHTIKYLIAVAPKQSFHSIVHNRQNCL